MGVSSKQFIPAITRQGYFDVLPGQPGNRARLRIDFHIDEERHLVASMYDIQREREIRNERVTRLR